MESILTALLNKGGPLGLMVAFIFIVMTVGVYLRQKGIVSIGDKTKVVAKDRLASIDTRLGGIERRVTSVESDLKNRPTRREVHDLDIAVTKLDGRLQGLEKVTNSTNHSVLRIEEHMLRNSRLSRD